MPLPWLLPQMNTLFQLYFMAKYLRTLNFQNSKAQKTVWFQI
jgi:hypothetical protein